MEAAEKPQEPAGPKATNITRLTTHYFTHVSIGSSHAFCLLLLYLQLFIFSLQQHMKHNYILIFCQWFYLTCFQLLSCVCVCYLFLVSQSFLSCSHLLFDQTTLPVCWINFLVMSPEATNAS